MPNKESHLIVPDCVTEGERAHIRDVVVIRPPADVSSEQTLLLAQTLATKQFLPILLPFSDQSLVVDRTREYPTDYFREVDGMLMSLPHGDFLQRVMRKAGRYVRTDSAEYKKIISPPDLYGGNLVYLESGKLFVYADPESEEGQNNFLDEYDRMAQQQKQRFFEDITLRGWRVVHAKTAEIRIGSTTDQEDLDFVLSLFTGKDDCIHAITAHIFTASFFNSLGDIREEIQFHEISDAEALRGGCNVADLRRGSVLISPNRHDTPTTFSVLQEYAKAEIIEAPEGFLDGEGGPRCSISSFSIE